jgi:hypothetical protein
MIFESSPNRHTTSAMNGDDADMHFPRIRNPLRVVRRSRIVRGAIRRLAGPPGSHLGSRS